MTHHFITSSPRSISFHIINHLQFKRHHQSTSFLNLSYEKYPDISPPHWNSEALVPTFVPATRTVKSFIHALDRKEHSSLGDEFLKNKHGALIHSANSVVELNALVKEPLFMRTWHSKATAFQVGPGGSLPRFTKLRTPPVFLTHNHFPRPYRKGVYTGLLPHDTKGNAKSGLTDRGQIELDRISEKRYGNDVTQYLVMLKTLQQARMEEIWEPCFAYVYKWGDTTFATPCAGRTALRSSLDVGGMKVSPSNPVIVNRQKLFPSRNVRRVANGTIFAALGFPGIKPPNQADFAKSPIELQSYLSGRGWELRACVGQARFCGFGKLFDEDRIEMIGVQNIVTPGSSGGPLISIDDDDGRFMGLAVDNSLHEGNLRGSSFITVDSPVIIAMYLQFILPSYPLDEVPPEILSYLDQNERFCRWYVEVAWQRLSEKQRLPGLERHWSRFGNLARPKHRKILIPDVYDDWRGVGEINSRLSDLQWKLKDLSWTALRFCNRLW